MVLFDPYFDEDVFAFKKILFMVPKSQSQPPVIYETVGKNGISSILLMEEILHHLGCIKPYEYWDIYYISWCRISSINSINWCRISSLQRI